MAVKFDRPPSPKEAEEVLRDYRGAEGISELPSAPEFPILVRTEPDRPQPRRDRVASDGMSVTVGRAAFAPAHCWIYG
jgi:aspartate-semialdehyde dehydrogenase